MQFDQLKRREFITLLGSVTAWPLAARAQQPGMPLIGVLSATSSTEYNVPIAGFHHGLSSAGYVAGRNALIEYRWAEGQYARLPELAVDLVNRQVAVIFTAGSTPATLAARAATSTIPIVFFVGGDPVELGLVSSLTRPERNLTGVTSLTAEIGSKRLELLHELIPGRTNFALLVNPNSPAQAEPLSQAMQAAAGKLGLQLDVFFASTGAEIDNAFASLTQLHMAGLVIGPDTFFNTQRERIAGLSLRYVMPTIYQHREFTAAGGLMSYGNDLGEMFRLCGVYVGRILNGEKVAELPVQQATKVELIINLKIAKALGLTFPLTLLGRADEVIE